MDSAFEVMVASGEKLQAAGKCLQVPIKVQGTTIVADFYLLPLPGYDAVLGINWLKSLGPIV
uniref:Uncharacterized protein n=1 Tax=Nelumbo nucifera TaxID=4432 RepID=A0A822ZKY4_NELNU|nr:TPA_asm: hypothetical protein HUJ06_004062 [Nelumbo nucifera]